MAITARTLMKLSRLLPASVAIGLGFAGPAFAAPADLLANFPFTDGDDYAFNQVDWWTWRVGNGNPDLSFVNLGLGDDVIIGKTNPDYPSPFSPDREVGFKNRGVITNPGGTLTIEGHAFPSHVRIDPAEPSYGFVNETLVMEGSDPGTYSGVIYSSDGDDRFYAYADSYPGQLAWGMYLGSQPNFSAGQIVGVSVTDMAGGNDELVAEAYANGKRAHGIHINWAPSKVLMGEGDDHVDAYAKVEGADTAVGLKISNGAMLDLGPGNDLLNARGDSTDRGWGIQTTGGGILRAGDGNDNITGTGNGPNSFSTGVFNQTDGQILLEGGNDILRGVADEGRGIWNQEGALIDAGEGDDTVLGETTSSGVAAIVNDGVIDMGIGNDTVNAMAGGFDGDGNYFMGEGDDTVAGFGSGTFDGGAGVDTIKLGKGVYTFDAGAGTLSSDGTTMNVVGFEQIAGVNGGLFELQSGQFQVDAAGVGSSSDMPELDDTGSGGTGGGGGMGGAAGSAGSGGSTGDTGGSTGGTAGSTAGSGGSIAGTGGSTAGSGGSAAASAEEEQEDGGFGCNIPAQSEPGPTALLLALAAAVGIARRRRH